MSSTYKTEYLKLNSWEASDRPQRNDFNSDNTIIDTVLGEHLENDKLHLTSSEKTRVSQPIVLVSYAGDGSESRLITLPAVASAVVVYRDGMPPVVYDSTTGCTKVYSAIAVYGGGATSGITLNGSGLNVSQSAEASGGIKLCFNELNVQYKISLIR